MMPAAMISPLLRAGVVAGSLSATAELSPCRLGIVNQAQPPAEAASGSRGSQRPLGTSTAGSIRGPPSGGGRVDGYRSGQTGLTVDQQAQAYGGSNPPPSTRRSPSSSEAEQ